MQSNSFFSSIKSVLQDRDQFVNNKILDLAAYRTMVKDRSAFKPSKSIFVSFYTQTSLIIYRTSNGTSQRMRS